MKKLLTFLVIILLISYGLLLLSGEEKIVLSWGDYIADIHPVILTVLLIALLFSFYYTCRMAVIFWRMPRNIRLYFTNFRDRKMQNATLDGLIGLELNDTKTIEKALYVLENVPENHTEFSKISEVVKFKARHALGLAQPVGRSSPYVENLELKNNITQAIKQKDWVSVLNLCERASGHAHYDWLSHAQIFANLKLSLWQNALDSLDFALKKSLITKTYANQLRSAVYCAHALTISDGNMTKNTFVKASLKYTPLFLPAVIVQVHLLQLEKNLKAAAKLIESVWTISPHPHLGIAYYNLFNTENLKDKLTRARSLAARNPHNFESTILVANSALSAGNSSEFLAILAEYTETPSQRICLLLYNYELQRSANSAAVQEWLIRSLNSPLDMGWNYDGVLSQKWSLFHPISGDLCIPIWHSGSFTGTIINPSSKNPLPIKQLNSKSDIPLLAQLLA